jgi:hypothetical protein
MTMQRHAIVQHGIVVQATMIRDGDTETAQALGAIPCPEWVSVGDRYDGAVFTAGDALAVPASVPRRQAMAVLIKYGHDTEIDNLLTQQVSQAEASGDQGAILAAKLAKNDWLESQEFQRAWPTLQAVSQLLGWTSEYVDQLFIEAKTL